ncbi:MAG: purine-nucleoside phosphorylase [Verrucomicrobiota bacterium]|nr:purine-nucleoside phosphorylase [Verrucomicrobiota bacterium]
MQADVGAEFGSMRAEVAQFEPEWGMVLGSGLGPFAERLKVERAISFADVPGLPPSKVAGHAGRFLLTEIVGHRTIVAQGRAHFYEGHSARDVTAGVRFMAAAGVRRLILTNAAGTVNPEFSPGDWMLITDHLNLTGTSPLLGGANFIDMTEVYSCRLQMHFAKVAASREMVLHEGVYAGLQGPQYETPAEVKMLRGLGADAVGMSTVLEAIQARALGIEVAGFSCLTNWAAGLGKTPLTHQEVLETGRLAADKLGDLVEEAVGAL